MKVKLIGAAASFVAACIAVVPAHAEQLRYRVRLLSPAASAAAAAINPKGDVAGYEGASSSTIGAVIFKHDKTVAQLGTLGGATSAAHGINSNDQVTGTSSTATPFISHAFRWKGGVLTDLGSLGTGSNAFSQGVAINEAGQVAGNTGFGADGEHAFVWTKAGMKDLGVLPGMSYTEAHAINTAGHVVGTASMSGVVTRGFLYRDGALLDLQPDEPSPATQAFGLNDADQVVGVASLASPSGVALYQAFVWDGGVMKALGMARGTDTSSRATAINNHGVVVGVSSLARNTVGFVYDGTSMADLNTLVDKSSGWVFTDALSINDKGQITGNGLYGGVAHPYLLTPIVK